MIVSKKTPKTSTGTNRPAEYPRGLGLSSRRWRKPTRGQGRWGTGAAESSPPLEELWYNHQETFGFKPHADFRRSRQILDPPDRHPRTGVVEFGHEGKPLYIQGPHDNAGAIMRQLARTAGEGNYDFLIMAPEPPPGWDEDDWD